MSKTAVILAIAAVLVLGTVGWFGCQNREKSTPELIADMKSKEEKERVIAVRTLAQRKGDAAQTVPVLIAALKDKDADIRRSAAIGLGNCAEAAKEAIPGLQALLTDHDARVQEAAGVALSRIDHNRFPTPPKPKKGR